MGKLSDDELWEKCKINEIITTEDLGITPCEEDGFYHTEGIKYTN